MGPTGNGNVKQFPSPNVPLHCQFVHSAAQLCLAYTEVTRRRWHVQYGQNLLQQGQIRMIRPLEWRTESIYVQFNSQTELSTRSVFETFCPYWRRRKKGTNITSQTYHVVTQEGGQGETHTFVTAVVEKTRWATTDATYIYAFTSFVQKSSMCLLLFQFSHTHPSHSQNSRLLTSSLSLGVPVPRATQCMRGV